MKDPLDVEERPYEVLGTAPDASIAEVEKKYLAFIRDRKNIRRRHAATVAYDRLRRVERRLEDEMFYYPSVDVSESEIQTGPPMPFEHELAPPNLDFDLCELAKYWQVGEDDYEPLTEREVQLGNISFFQESLLSCLPMDLPN